MCERDSKQDPQSQNLRRLFSAGIPIGLVCVGVPLQLYADWSHPLLYGREAFEWGMLCGVLGTAAIVACSHALGRNRGRLAPFDRSLGRKCMWMLPVLAGSVLTITSLLQIINAVADRSAPAVRTRLVRGSYVTGGTGRKNMRYCMLELEPVSAGYPSKHVRVRQSVYNNATPGCSLRTTTGHGFFGWTHVVNMEILPPQPAISPKAPE